MSEDRYVCLHVNGLNPFRFDKFKLDTSKTGVSGILERAPKVRAASLLLKDQTLARSRRNSHNQAILEPLDGAREQVKSRGLLGWDQRLRSHLAEGHCLWQKTTYP